MKLTRLLLSTSLSAAFVYPVSAQQISFSDVDTDGNGVLTETELEAAFGVDGAAELLAAADANGDRTLTREEVNNAFDDEEDDEDDEEDDEDDDEDDGEDDEDDEDNDEDDDDDGEDDGDEGGGDDEEDDD